MRTQIEISNFRGVEQGAIDDLAPLSVLVGTNNSGKSTVLEALWFNVSGGDARVAATIATRRGWCGLGCMDQLFYHPGPATMTVTSEAGEVRSSLAIRNIDNEAAELDAQCPPGGSRLVIGKTGKIGQLHLIDRGPLPHRLDLNTFIAVETITRFGLLEDAYSEAAAAGNEALLEDLLGRIGLKDHSLRILKRDDQYVLHTISDNKSVAVYFAGDGYKRLLYIACVLASKATGLTLLEEPECFQHPSHVRELAQLIWAAIDQGTQVVLSTHSLDLLRHLFFLPEARLDRAAVFHTKLKEGRLSAIRIAGERARERMEQLGEDLRQ